MKINFFTNVAVKSTEAKQLSILDSLRVIGGFSSAMYVGITKQHDLEN